MSLSRPATADNAIALRVHRMRVARGACWVIAFALLGGAGLAALDAATWLSPGVRGLGLAVWLTASGVCGWYLVLGRWRADRSPEDVRAAAREASGNAQAAAAAAVVLLGSLLAALLVPNAAVHLRRVALPWYRTGNPFRIVVTSNNPVVARGKAVVLTAYVESDDRAPLPANAVLVCRYASGIEERRPMRPEENGAFRASYISVMADVNSTSVYEYQYRVEAAGATSEWFTVTSVSPNMPSPATTLRVVPPPYANGQIAERTIAGFEPVSGLQYSRLDLALRFASGSRKVKLEWRTDPKSVGESITLTHGSDDRQASASLMLRQSGWLYLTFSDGQDGKELLTEYPIAVTVTPQSPPRFQRLAGISPLPLRIRPGQKLPVELAAANDIEIGGAVFEFAAGTAAPQSVPILLVKPTPGTAVGRLEWSLPEGLRAGETVRYRIRVIDTRQVPELRVNPQETVYPVTGWAALVVDPTAPPIGEQEIENQREFLKQALGTAAGTVREALENSKGLQGQARAAFDVETQLQQTRQQVEGIGPSLAELAGVVSLTPELRPLASEIREIALQRIPAAGQSLAEATNTADPSERQKSIAAAVDRLSSALGSLERSYARNLTLGQTRLDSYRLSAVLADQHALAEMAKPGSGVAPEDLARRQKDLHVKFLQAIERSESMRVALGDANRRSILALAAEVSDLAADMSTLEVALKQLDAAVRKVVFARLAEDAAATADRVAAVLAQAESAARLAGLPLPQADSFRHTAELLAAEKAVESLTELQRLADALAGMAASLEKVAADRADTRIACRQYAAWLEDQLTRFRSSTQGRPGGLKDLPIPTQRAIREELAALRPAVESLGLPPDSTDLKDLKADVSKRLDEVEEAFGRSASAAEAAMRLALTAINRLADRVPGVHDRLAAMRGELDKLRQEQDAIRKAMGPLDVTRLDMTDAKVVAPLRKSFNALVTRQKKQAETFKALDLPRLEFRRERMLAALAAASADLEAGLPFDVYASQEWVKKEFEDLKHILADRAYAGEDAAKEARGLESPLQRVQRMSWNRRTAADLAVKLRGAPRNLQASDAARAELATELDELILTRVGPSAQFLKQRARNQYAQLRKESEPDRMVVEQAALAETLNELAALMADTGDLARPFEPVEKAYVPAAADRFLPSRPLAAEVRALERDYRLTRDRLTHLAGEVHRRTHAPGDDPHAKSQKLLEARGEELASNAVKLAETLDAAANSRYQEDPARAVFIEASRAVRTAATHLTDAALETAKGEMAAADKDRREADARLVEHAKRITAAAPAIQIPTPPTPGLAATAEALLRAEFAMRRAEALLGTKPDLPASAKAMTAVSEALAEAAARRLASGE